MAAHGQASMSPSPQPLSRVEKAIVLLLALGKPRASELLKQLGPEDLKKLHQSAAALRPITANDLDQLVEEFAEDLSGHIGFSGSTAELTALFDGVLSSEELAKLTTQTPAMIGRDSKVGPLWDRIKALDATTLTSFLETEHPQIAGLVLSRIGPETSAKLIAGFPTAQRNELLTRMLGIGVIDADALRLAEQAIEDTLFTTNSGIVTPVLDNHIGLAQILNRLDKQQMDDAMHALSHARPAEAIKVKRMLFAFEDLVALTNEARVKLFDQAPMEQVILALKGADPDLQQVVLAALSPRGKRMVEAELQGGAVAADRDIAAARRALVEAVLKLVAGGEINLAPA